MVTITPNQLSGDVGTLFYIILSGEVSVKLPTIVEFETTPEDFFIFCIQYFEDIEWTKIPNGEILMSEVQSEAARFEITYETMTEKL